MLHWLTHHWDILEGAAERLMAADRQRTAASLQSHFDALAESERLMIRCLNGEQPQESEPGSLELGPILYLLDCWLSREHPVVYAGLKAAGLPASAVQPGDFARWEQELETTGVVGGDGTLFGTTGVARYAQFDPGWAASAVECMLSDAGILGAPYPFQHGSPAILTVSAGDRIRIALAGDWGSGAWGDGPWGTNDHGRSAPAVLVMDQIKNQQPDLTIHLGDVYYGGTATESAEYVSALWQPGRLGAFALNSNHDMFNGGRGYFETALAAGGAFAAQRQTSYFAIESDDWVVLGLDTAYFDASPGFMDGALIDPDQIAFVRAFKTKKRLVLLTHHNALSTSGTAFIQNPRSGALWRNVVDALDGRYPDFWYWGHLHNGIVYKTVPWDDSRGPVPPTLCRCVGHGALPFGRAYYVDQQPGNVEYFSSTPVADPVLPYQARRVRNGWAMVTIDKGGLTEEFWEIGDTRPAWQATHPW